MTTNAGSRRRPVPTAKGQQSRSAILRAAGPLFAEQGYRGASLAKVAEAVGLTQPGLLHHFPSKEHLLLALVQERYHADGRLLAEHAEVGKHLLDALAEIMHHNATAPDAVKLFTVLVAESISAEHPAHDHFVDRYRKVRNRMARELRAGQASGVIRDDVALDTLVPIIVAVMDGLQIQWLLDGEVDLLASFEHFRRLLFADLDPARRATRADAGPPDP